MVLAKAAALLATGSVVVYVEDCQKARTRARAKICRLRTDAK